MKKILALVAVFALVAFATPVFAAANPFMDVPMNHWAYDAIGQLAARGVLSGYPNGAYKGNQPMTRYEVASAVARALAVVDMTKASKQDVEMLKKLVVEFKDELDALGVKVDQLDSRVSLIESRLGGWQIWGQMRFDARFSGNDGVSPGEPDVYGNVGENQFHMERYRIFLRRYIDDKVTFTARIGAAQGGNMQFQRYWVDVKFPWDITASIGRWAGVDWEGEDGMYADIDGPFALWGPRGFQIVKPFAMGSFTAFIARPDEGNTDETAPVERYDFGARVKFNFNEYFWLSLNARWRNYDALVARDNEHTYWGALGVNFTPDIALKGSYYAQDLWTGISPNAWQAVLDVKQSALKFTSLWAEYWGFDEGFTGWNGTMPWDEFTDANGMSLTSSDLGRYDNILFVRLQQRWSDKFTTFQRYLKGNARSALAEDTTNWTLGIRYQYTPALNFELAYDKIEGYQTEVDRDDHLIRFRTNVVF